MPKSDKRHFFPQTNHSLFNYVSFHVKVVSFIDLVAFGGIDGRDDRQRYFVQVPVSREFAKYLFSFYFLFVLTRREGLVTGVWEMEKGSSLAQILKDDASRAS